MPLTKSSSMTCKTFLTLASGAGRGKTCCEMAAEPLEHCKKCIAYGASFCATINQKWPGQVSSRRYDVIQCGKIHFSQAVGCGKSYFLGM